MSNPRDIPVLALAAALEALAASGSPCFTPADLEEALSWLSPPARSAALSALLRSGWLDSEPGGYALTEAGRQRYEVLRRAALPEAGARAGLPAGMTTEQIVRALLTRSVDELAAAGRDALVPVLPLPPLLITKAVIRAAETHALSRRPEPEP